LDLAYYAGILLNASPTDYAKSYSDIMGAGLDDINRYGKKLEQ